ncbi:MAG TPA: hypothetical protein VFE15_08515, partial [Marmoricola sp.]|nr:hypothetical protein [Marmoricola sp.]
MNPSTSKFGKAAAALALTGMAALGVAACGSSSDSPKKLTAIAHVPALTGKSTAIKLDAGFVKALGSLKLTPGVLGTAQLTNGSLIFP